MRVAVVGDRVPGSPAASAIEPALEHAAAETGWVWIGITVAANSAISSSQTAGGESGPRRA